MAHKNTSIIFYKILNFKNNIILIYSIIFYKEILKILISMKINENVYRNCPIIVLGQFFLSMKNFFNEMKSDLKFSAYFELFEFFFFIEN